MDTVDSPATEDPLQAHRLTGPAALVMKANILLELQHVSEAHQELQHAARIDPHDSDVLFGLSYVLDRLNRPSESLVYLESVLARNRGNAAMLRHKGWLLLKLNRIEEAIGHLNEARAQDSCDVEALRGKGLALLADGKRSEAIDVIRTAARRSEQFVSAAGS